MVVNRAELTGIIADASVKTVVFVCRQFGLDGLLLRAKLGFELRKKLLCKVGHVRSPFSPKSSHMGIGHSSILRQSPTIYLRKILSYMDDLIPAVLQYTGLTCG
ncbi:hypothetical protein D3C77_401680 [compost metagenome]